MWQLVLDNFTGSPPKVTGRALLGGKTVTSLIVIGDLVGAVGTVRGLIKTPDGDKIVELYRMNPASSAWLAVEVNEVGALNGVAVPGLHELEVYFTGGGGLIGLSVWIDGMEVGE